MGFSIKKLIIIVLALILTFSGCSFGRTFYGSIYGYSTADNCYLICDGSGNCTAFYVTDKTELVWKDTSYIPESELNSTNWEELQWDWLLGDCKIEIKAGRKAEPSEDILAFENAENWYYAEKITVLERYEEPVEEKPVIYLYPEEKKEVSVNLDFNGVLTTTYPEYKDGWKVTATPEGTLFDENGKEYYCLYWEGISGTEYDFSKGFCVPGDETADFLESSLEKLGLSPREANEFIIYWLPRMEQNAYNLISFQNEAYTESAKLEISPDPDTLIRVFMAWKPLDEPIDIEPQELSAPERTGFTAVEWGGAEIK